MDAMANSVQPSSPRTPQRPMVVDDGMVLRSGRTPGRTPTRMARAKTPSSGATTVSTGLTPRHGDEEFNLSFPEACDGLLGGIGTLTTDPQLIEGIMALDTDMTGLGGDFLPFPGAGPGPHDALRSFTGQGLSPLMAGKLLSPRMAAMMRGARGHTGLTPPRGAYNPSPYRLRSTTNSPAGYKIDAYGGMSPDLMFGMREASSKRQLIADPEAMVTTRTSPRKRIAMELKGVVAKAGPLKKRKDKREHKDRRTSSAPKRGEYRCGKCGFFPKKNKHSCELEKARRQSQMHVRGGAAASAVPVSVLPPQQAEVHKPASEKLPGQADPMLSYLNVPHPPSW